MNASGLQFAAAAHITQCEAHIDGEFPTHYAIQLMTSGSMYFDREGCRSVSVCQPIFFWTELSSHYRYGPGITGSWNHHFVTFRGELADSLYLPILEKIAPHGYCPVSAVGDMEAAFLQLIRFAQDSLCNWDNRIHALHRVLYIARESQQIGQDVPDTRLQEIRKLVDSDPRRNVHFTYLAKQYGYSYSSFRRQFRLEFGCAPGQYLIRQRLQLAARRLLESRDSILAIGESLGYADPARFSRVFKQHFGRSPLQFRKSLGGMAPDGIHASNKPKG